MTMPCPEDLRVCSIEAVAEGLSGRGAAKLFNIRASSVIRWAERRERIGTVAAKPIGGSRGKSIEGADRVWLLELIAAQPDLRLEEMRAELARQRLLSAGHGSIWRFCDCEKLTLKKSLRAAQQDRPDIAEARTGGGDCYPAWIPPALC
jgi:transposase